MWKRILVLVLFLFGVFWWLSNRDDAPKDVVTPDAEVEISVDEEGEETTDKDSSGEDEKSDEDESDEEEAVEKTAKEIIAAPVQTVTTKVVEVASKPVYVAPVYVQPKVEPKPDPVPAVTTNVKVYMYEWGLDLSSKTFPAGTVVFAVQNNGRFTHEFEIAGKGNLGKVTPSMTETFSVQLQPGTYEVYSPRREDRERGVSDTIVVE